MNNAFEGSKEEEQLQMIIEIAESLGVPKDYSDSLKNFIENNSMVFYKMVDTTKKTVEENSNLKAEIRSRIKSILDELKNINAKNKEVSMACERGEDQAFDFWENMFEKQTGKTITSLVLFLVVVGIIIYAVGKYKKEEKDYDDYVFLAVILALVMAVMGGRSIYNTNENESSAIENLKNTNPELYVNIPNLGEIKKLKKELITFYKDSPFDSELPEGKEIDLTLLNEVFEKLTLDKVIQYDFIIERIKQLNGIDRNNDGIISQGEWEKNLEFLKYLKMESMMIQGNLL